MWAGIVQSVQRLATGWTAGGSNPGEGEIFRTCPDRSWGPPSLLYNGYRVFHGGKERPGRKADPSPPSSAVVKKGYSYTSIPPMGHTACTEHQCLCRGALYLYHVMCGLGSTVGIVTGYGLDGPGSNPGGAQDFPHLSRPAPEPTQPPVQWAPGLSRG